MTSATVLTVEDSPTQAERLRMLLAQAGHRVMAARDGEEALRCLDGTVPDLVITDVMMPRMDGYELCARLKADERLQDVPVILLTSLATPEDVVRGLQCGADNFIRKPYDGSYLLSRVGNILTGRRLRHSGKLQVGLEVDLGGERHFISSDRQQILDFLLSTYEEVAAVNAQLEQRSAEVAARNAELDAVLDATADGVALLDDRGQAIVTNAELARIAAAIPGVSLSVPLEANVAAVLDVAEDPDRVRAFAEGMTADRERRGELELEIPVARLSLLVVTRPVHRPDGAWLGRLFLLRDVTHQREVDRMKSELVATVSHELRTPLASVLGFAELLTVRELDDQTRRQYLGTIVEEAQRLAALVDDFLDLHRIEAGDFSIRPDRVDVRDVLRRQVETVAGQSAAHELHAAVPGEPLVVLAEEARLVQVLANLLSNAVKYSPGGGRVVAEARRAGDAVHVSVADEGIGIPPEQQDRIFTKFFRVDSSDTRTIGGTGLGLALCREIVQAHGGEIGFESEPGRGSTFWFRLPAAPADDTTGRDRP